MAVSVSFWIDSVVFSGAAVSVTDVSAVGSVCILDKVSDGLSTEHALIRSASSRMMIFFMLSPPFAYMVAKSERKHQCAKIGFTDLTGTVSYEYIRLSRNSEGLPLHLFPLRSPNRTPITENIFEKKKKPSPKLIGKDVVSSHFDNLLKGRSPASGKCSI